MSWSDAVTQYARALKQGQKYHNACVIRGQNPYPLVLDDVLVRFDDKRMAAAVDVLKGMAQERQIILFSCQGREASF